MGKKRKAFVCHQKGRDPGDTALMNINLNSHTASFTLTNSFCSSSWGCAAQQRPKAETDRYGFTQRGYCLLLCSIGVSPGSQKQSFPFEGTVSGFSQSLNVGRCQRSLFKQRLGGESEHQQCNLPLSWEKKVAHWHSVL